MHLLYRRGLLTQEAFRHYDDQCILKCRCGGIGIPACRQAGARDQKTMYYVYAIKSLNKNYIYVGLTNNSERRIEQHNSGKERTTRPYSPFITLIIENYPNRIEARKREKYLKSGCGKEYLKSLI